jgi:hypothetical protein
MVMTYMAKLFTLTLFGWSDTVWTVIIAAIWILIAFIPAMLHYQYVSYSDDGELIVFRYFNAGIAGGRKNSIEISKKTFAGYKTETRLWGLSMSITLYQNVNNGTAKYSPVHISALGRQERSKIFRSLNRYSSETLNS